jgi:hypothetical protein
MVEAMSWPVWWGKPRSARKESDKLEQKIAAKHGGKQVPGSGSGLFKKGDHIYDLELVEQKTTAAKSMIVKLEWLEKIFDEALAIGKEPIILLKFPGFSLIGEVVKNDSDDLP